MSEYVGSLTAPDLMTEYTATAFLVRQILGEAATAELVQVVATTGVGADAAPGFVDVHPLVHQIDGNNAVTPHGVIHRLPFMRIQGGANGVILDPAVGDIGVAVFCARDISVAKEAAAPSPPGSRRRFDWADGIYLGCVVNGTPSQFVQFNAGGISITSPSTVTITAPNINIIGTVAITGLLTNNTVHVGSTHIHGGVQTGAGDTGLPF